MKIVEELQRMRLQDPIEGAEYYSISLFSSDGKTLSYSVISSLVGFTETKPIQEIRQACKVYPKRMLNL